jgi:hypothetical protein
VREKYQNSWTTSVRVVLVLMARLGIRVLTKLLRDWVRKLTVSFRLERQENEDMKEARRARR